LNFENNFLNLVPYVTYGIIALLILGGLFLLIHKPKTKEQVHFEQKTVLHNNMSLRDRMDIINGKNAFGSNAVKNFFFDVRLTLAKMNKIDEYSKIRVSAIILAILSIIACAGIKNLFLVPVLAPVAFFIPFALVKVRYSRYKKNLEKELETALSLITISYNRTSNFLTSVEECLETLPPLVKPFFEDFVVEVTSVNANMTTALIELKTKIENRTFQQWVDRVIVCLNDRTAVSSLYTYVNEFADNRAIQNELDAEIFSGKIEMYLMIGFVFFTPVLLYFIQREAFDHLMNDTLGKIAVAISLVLVIIVFLIGNKIAKPVKFRGNKN